MALNIALLPGDGIGPVVTAEAARLLARIGELYHHTIRFSTHPVVGDAIDATACRMNAIGTSDPFCVERPVSPEHA